MAISQGLIILGVLMSLFVVSMLYKGPQNFVNFHTDTERRIQELVPIFKSPCKPSDFVWETSRERKNDFVNLIISKAMDIFLAIFKKRPPATTNKPSPCVWAILTCCKPGTANYSLECFQIMQCSGPFWDQNPCTENMGIAAIACGRNYYGASELTENEFEFDEW